MVSHSNRVSAGTGLGGRVRGSVDPHLSKESLSQPAQPPDGSDLSPPISATPATWENHFISQIKNPFCAVNNGWMSPGRLGRGQEVDRGPEDTTKLPGGSRLAGRRGWWGGGWGKLGHIAEMTPCSDILQGAGVLFHVVQARAKLRWVRLAWIKAAVLF
jgi:hypothetical protein